MTPVTDSHIGEEQTLHVRYAAAIKALKFTVAIGIGLTVYAALAGSMIRFEDYMNPPRYIPGWVRFSWVFSKTWWMGGWLVLSVPIFLIAMVWINERMRQKENKEKAHTAATPCMSRELPGFTTCDPRPS